MPLSSDTIRERLRMTFGSESQEIVAGKLNMSQGNVSKLLSGSQMPTLDTLYSISEKYGVSVDWLLGISEQRKIQSADSLSSYSVAAMVITCIVQRGAKVNNDGQSKPISLEIEDPILKTLIRKSLVLSNTDNELYVDWKNTKLSLFDDKALIWRDTWRDDPLPFLVGEASTEADWLEVWEEAKKAEADYDEIMSDCVGPFGR